MKSQVVILLFFVIILTLPIISLGQEDTSGSKVIVDYTNQNLIRSGFIPGNFSILEVDLFGNIFVFNQKNQLVKYNANGDSLNTWYNVMKYGKLSMLDVSNPMKILLYYRSFSTAVILDRLLTFRNVIDLRKNNIFKVKAMTSSYDNYFWLFDEQDFKMKKIDDEGNLLSETTDWRLIFDKAPSPVCIAEFRNDIWVYDDINGFYIFDYYGSLKKRIALANFEFRGFNGENIYGIYGDNLILLNPADESRKTIPLPAEMKSCRNLRLTSKALYGITEKGIHIYNYKR